MMMVINIFNNIILLPEDMIKMKKEKKRKEWHDLPTIVIMFGDHS